MKTLIIGFSAILLISCSITGSDDPENVVRFYVEGDPGNEIELTVSRNGEDLNTITASPGDETDDYKAEAGDVFTGKVCSDGDDAVSLYIALNGVDINVLHYGNHGGEWSCANNFTTDITQRRIDFSKD